MSLPSALWSDRPIEVANLLNPAFGAIVLRDAVIAYGKAADGSMPFAVAFLILPLALHPATRQSLPKSTAALMHAWLEQNTALQADVVQRVRRMLPYTRESLVFALQHQFLAVNGSGRLVNIRARMRDPFPDGSDPAACRGAAKFIGSWFGKVPDPSFLFSLWGMRP